MDLNVNITWNITNKICFGVLNFSFKNKRFRNDITMLNNVFRSIEGKHNYTSEIKIYRQAP